MDKKKFEIAKCAICNADNAKLLYEKNGFKIVECRNCKLVYVNPRLSAKTLKKMYESNALDPFDYLLENADADAKTFSRHLDILERYAPKGKLLDVGCAIGGLLQVAKKRGWDAYGTELTKHASAYCRKNGLKVETGTLQKSRFPGNYFDAITFTGSLEHMQNTLREMRLANKKLKGKGILLLTVPDIRSLHAPLLGKHWLQLKPEEHIHYFSPETIEKLLNKAGFEVLCTKHIANVRKLKTLIVKIGTYSKTLQKILNAIIGGKKSKDIFININPFDEMLAIARKRENS